MPAGKTAEGENVRRGHGGGGGRRKERQHNAESDLTRLGAFSMSGALPDFEHPDAGT